MSKKEVAILKKAEKRLYDRSRYVTGVANFMYSDGKWRHCSNLAAGLDEARFLVGLIRRQLENG